MDRVEHHFAAAGVLALTLLTALGLGLVATVDALPPQPGQPVLVLAAPWGIPAEVIVQQAGGRSISPWATHSMAALAAFDGDIPITTLRDRGVWTVMDGNRIAQLCGVQ